MKAILLTLLNCIILFATLNAQEIERKSALAVEGQLNYSFLEQIKTSDDHSFSALTNNFGFGVGLLWERELKENWFLKYGLRVSSKKYAFKFDGFTKSSGTAALRLPLLLERKIALENSRVVFSLGTEISYYGTFSSQDSISYNGELSSTISISGNSGFSLPLTLGVGIEKNSESGRRQALMCYLNKGFKEVESIRLEKKNTPVENTSFNFKATTLMVSYQRYLNRKPKKSKK